MGHQQPIQTFPEIIQLTICSTLPVGRSSSSASTFPLASTILPSDCFCQRRSRLGVRRQKPAETTPINSSGVLHKTPGLSHGPHTVRPNHFSHNCYFGSNPM